MKNMVSSKRFSSIISYYPLPYKNFSQKINLLKNNNPPSVEVEFFEDQKILIRLIVFQMKERMGSPKIQFINNKMSIKFREKFNFRRED